VKPSSAPIVSTSAAPRKPVPKPSNPYANYSTAESLGYQDPDAERYAAEVERRRTQGVAGDWEIISTSVPLSTATVVDGSENDRSDGNLKREAETPVDEEDTRQFKLGKKTVTLGEIYDPGMIPIKIKKELAEPVETTPTPGPSLATSNATNAPKWTTVQWKRPGEISQVEKTEEETPTLGEEQQAVKVEDQLINDDLGVDAKYLLLAVDPSTETPIVKSEEAIPAPSETSSSGSMFRKRKAPAGGSRGRRAL
jgi:WW domain-binding protein 4